MPFVIRLHYKHLAHKVVKKWKSFARVSIALVRGRHRTLSLYFHRSSSIPFSLFVSHSLGKVAEFSRESQAQSAK